MSGVLNPFEHIIYEIKMYLYTYNIIPNHIDLHDQMMVNINVDSRAIHLRNLAVFFAEKKTNRYWHATDYLTANNNIRLLKNDQLFKEIRDYTSRATCHLLDERLNENYKSDATKCYLKAFILLIDAITDFIKALQLYVKPDFVTQWKDPFIQTEAANILYCINSRAPVLIQKLKGRSDTNV